MRTSKASLKSAQTQYTSDSKHFTVYAKNFMFGIMDVVFHYDATARYTVAWAGDSKEITRRVYRNNRLIFTTLYI